MGDRALRLFARVLDSVRPNDIVGRFGGEEFVDVLPDCSVTDAHSVLARVEARLTDVLDPAAIPRLTASFGIARSSEAEAFVVDVVARADAALLNAKRSGRDRIVEWTSDATVPVDPAV